MTTETRARKLMTKTAPSLFVASLIAGSLFTFAVSEAEAAPKMDEFHSNSKPKATHINPYAPDLKAVENPLGKQGAYAMMSDQNDPVVRWFEDMDKAIAVNRKTTAEVAILRRPFNQEAERVQEWTRVANRVAAKYKYLAMILRKTPTPPGKEGLREYADLQADWYADSAAIYDELTKPRKAARTMEELEEGLQQIKDRAEGLRDMRKSLLAMDMDLRGRYHVHMPEHDDALQKYVKVGTPEEIKRVGGQTR